MNSIDRKTLAIALAAIVLASALSFSIASVYLMKERKITVDGGLVVASSPDEATVRVLSERTVLRVDGFEGTLTLTNCFPGSGLENYTGDVDWNGATASVQFHGEHGEYSLVAPMKASFGFALIGDTQGMNVIFKEAIGLMQGRGFVLHCGDLTPSGRSAEYDAVQSTMNESSVPIFTTPGNHDAKNNGTAEYTARLAPLNYSFTYSDITFAFVDSTDLEIDQGEINWLSSVFQGAERKIIVTHAPSYDPIEGNHTLDGASCERLRDFAATAGVAAIFSGHVHAFNHTKVGDTDYIITGGGGGSLTAGVHHFVMVNVTATGMSFDEIEIDDNATTDRSHVAVIGKNASQSFAFAELIAMPRTAGNSSFQNQLGNYVGGGRYWGVKVGYLVALMGGMDQNDILRITSSDMYSQEFGYLNVCPDATWQSLQGDMILALGYDSLTLPDWTDGPRIVMLPADGEYSNADCAATSYPGQGYNVYPSAGGRWAKMVVTIEVVEVP